MIQSSHKQTTVSAVGIDVAKTTLSVCFRHHEGSERALSIRNIEADIKEYLLPRLEQYCGKIVMESTGHYHWRAALMLTDAGLDVRVVNPLLSKQYTAGTIRKVKTDPADASGLARMAEVADNLPPSFALSREQLQARKKLGLMASLTRERQALEASLRSMREANGVLGFDDSPAEQDVARAVQSLRRSLAKLEREFTVTTMRDEGAAREIAASVTIPGVSELTASIAFHWFNTSIGSTPKSWIAYAGLDVSSRESGTWRGRCRLTKRGNNYLRRRIYNAAWGAVMNDAPMKAYYDSLRGQGRCHVEALIIIARKIVRMMFAIRQTGQEYRPMVLGNLAAVA